MTEFRLNIDRPTGVARLHSATSKHPNCQPQPKNEKDGYWQDFETVQEASDHASQLKLRFEHCQLCVALYIETYGVSQ